MCTDPLAGVRARTARERHAASRSRACAARAIIAASRRQHIAEEGDASRHARNHARNGTAQSSIDVGAIDGGLAVFEERGHVGVVDLGNSRWERYGLQPLAGQRVLAHILVALGVRRAGHPSLLALGGANLRLAPLYARASHVLSKR